MKFDRHHVINHTNRNRINAGACVPSAFRIRKVCGELSSYDGCQVIPIISALDDTYLFRGNEKDAASIDVRSGLLEKLESSSQELVRIEKIKGLLRVVSQSVV